ncbi:MAG: bifunctional oligoribonuclease/PAP phosphatase NrnA [Lachnospiraceae bacterium]|jgi:phosphoesterase RecJ-like protein|nr:bifunctional oligoribonuclease/PAP phosphatase NrnA [Lachnospiraceae bacterium]MEE3460694.1 bifunctional oligoribonuclease/PAP phosphatase NrnA [Lachnospiraceae bacterium]
MNEIKDLAKDYQNILIAGHLRPDGDCVGACISVLRYLRNIYPEKNIYAYLEAFPNVYSYLDPERKLIGNSLPSWDPDLFIAVDTSSPDRLGDAEEKFHHADKTLVIDHHVSNAGYGAVNYIEPDASSACEVIYGLMDRDIDIPTAEAVYTGIVTDSGGFRYSATSKKTMKIAGELMERGINFSKIMDECFYKRTFAQAQLLGRTLLESMLIMDGKCIVAAITMDMMELYGTRTEDIEGIVDQLRITRGVETAILLHETAPSHYKVSMRSNDYIDVSRIAVYFNGGGHVRAAGFEMDGEIHDVVNSVTAQIQLQMQTQGEC